MGFLLVSYYSHAQEIVKVKRAKGQYYLNNDITPKQAKDLAIVEAKIDALRLAGISETINSSKVLITVESNSKAEQLFNNIATVELNGAITSYNLDTIIEQKNEFGQTYYVAIINAEVIIYKTKSDPSFQLQVEGIEKLYKQGEELTFYCTPYANGYLKIFQISINTAGIIFPNQYEKTNQFVKDTKIKFPVRKGLSYTLDDIESNTLVFVYTKKEIPFIGKETVSGITEWIYKISPDERQVQAFSIIVK